MTDTVIPNGPFEIERKFLIPYPDIQALQSLPGCVRLDITQVYLAGGTARIRKSGYAGGCVYTHTEKHKISELKRVELERTISAEEYAELLKTADPNFRPISKIRLCIPYQGHTFEIDIFPFWQDKAVAEVELSAEDEEIAFPEWLEIIEEVTFGPSYKNTTLARIK